MDETDFIKGFVERIEGAVSEEKFKRYRNAVELYYKAMVHLVDYLLFTKYELIIDTLKQRLEETNKLDKELTTLFRGAHVVYRGTYRGKKSILDCKNLKNGIKTMAELSGIKEAMQEGLKKIS